MRKPKLVPWLTLPVEVVATWIKDPNVKDQMGMEIEESVGEEFYDLGANKDFWNKTSKAQARRQKMCKFGDIQIQDFCPVKGTMNREMTS